MSAKDLQRENDKFFVKSYFCVESRLDTKVFDFPDSYATDAT